jgi:hypothetical protein
MGVYPVSFTRFFDPAVGALVTQHQTAMLGGTTHLAMTHLPGQAAP